MDTILGLATVLANLPVIHFVILALLVVILAPQVFNFLYNTKMTEESDFRTRLDVMIDTLCELYAGQRCNQCGLKPHILTLKTTVYRMIVNFYRYNNYHHLKKDEYNKYISKRALEIVEAFHLKTGTMIDSQYVENLLKRVLCIDSI